MSNKETKYTKNQTMILLGKQKPFSILTEKALKAIDQVMEGNELLFMNHIRPLIYDVYTLGYINGKRAERNKK